MLVAAGLALPAVLLVSQPAAAAVTSQQPPPVSIVITAMSPRWATPRATITVTGTLHNNSRTAASQLTVQLFGSSTPVASVTALQQGMSPSGSPATAALPGRTWHASGQLAPGASTDWSVKVPASAIGMTTFGVYPIAAQVQGQFGNPLATATTYLPYEPDHKGSYASSRPALAKIAWLWPLIDVPLLNEPWQGNCSGPQAAALAQSLSPGGRLGELASTGTVDQDVTWVIDPAVLANARALTTCQKLQPRWAQTASAWLTNVASATSGRPLSVTPYGDPNAAALIAVGHGSDVTQSFALGRDLANNILRRPDLVALPPSGATSAPNIQAASIAWSPADVPGYGTVENLANADSIRTLVLSSSAFPGGQYSVLKTLDGGGSYMTALLASQALTQLLGSGTSTPGSVFSTRQAFLAETALLAQQVPAQPIVVAPPPRWAPSAALAAGLLADTSAPWLSQVTLTSLASAKHIPIVATQNWPDLSLWSTRITRAELRKLRKLDGEIRELQGIRAHPDPDMYLALSTLESSALQSTSANTVDAMLGTVVWRIVVQQQAVRIIAEKRITLGGLKGSVPVSIDNRLGYPVKIALQLQYNQASGIKIEADPPGLITVPARQTQTIRLRVQATAVGSTTVTMLLATQRGDPVSVPLRMTIQATQVGFLGMIIFAAALGVFLIASAARAVRRGRPDTGAGPPADNGPDNIHDGAGSADPAEADTVNAERASLERSGSPHRD